MFNIILFTVGPDILPETDDTKWAQDYLEQNEHQQWYVSEKLVRTDSAMFSACNE